MYLSIDSSVHAFICSSICKAHETTLHKSEDETKKEDKKKKKTPVVCCAIGEGIVVSTICNVKF